MAYKDVVLADNPSSYWRLGETSGTNADDSAASVDGTYTGGYTQGRPGLPSPSGSNLATALDGSTGYINIPADTNHQIGPGATRSIECWWKPSAPAQHSYLASKGTTADYEWGFLAYSTGEIQFITWTAAGLAHMTLTTAQVLSFSKPNHVVGAVTNGTLMSVYLNGDLVGSTSTVSNSPANASTNPTLIGRRADLGATSAAFGVIDEFAIYPTALTQAKVSKHYAAGAGLVLNNYQGVRADSGISVGEKIR